MIKNLLTFLTEPVVTIKEDDERRQARLVSGILIIAGPSMLVGAIAEMFILNEQTNAYILFGLSFVILIGYFVSRGRYYRLAVPIQLSAYIGWPVLSISLMRNYTAEDLLINLVFTLFTMLISSIIVSYRTTELLGFGNILFIALLPIIIPPITYEQIIVPLAFNAIGIGLILLLTRHRNLVEEDRQKAIRQINHQLELELTERKRAEEQMAYSATHDALTNLPNRLLFMDRLQHAMNRTKRHKDFMFAVLFLDLDRFKVVNDSLGHHAGDLLLIESASRLTACLRSDDTVARLGGDEFVILLENVRDISEVTNVADRILHDMALPHDLKGHKAFVLASIGIVMSAGRHELPENILRDADIAMYHAKGLGRGRYEIFEQSMLEQVTTRLELENDLRRAIERHEFVVNYQPIVDMKYRRIIGFEALVRWQHPELGLLLPLEFIPILEETGLIVPVGYWVLEEACRQLRIWQIQHPSDPPLTVNVNWSTRQCTETNMAQKIAGILQKTDLPPSTLNLELTESLLIEDAEFIIKRLTELRVLGVKVQLDDFGTGYSSLGYLHSLPIDTIKVDRTFINRLEANGNGLEIVKMILTLAHDLGMKVVAEGVETDNQLSKLQAMDCEYVQGFLIKKPVTSREIDALLGKPFDKIYQVK